MENIFVEFLPPWVETGLQPAFYDKESGTVLQQTARMYARVNMLIRMFNKLSKNTKTEIENFETTVNETVQEYIEKFNQLHDYVEDYFDNLDVQEEINNKLDAMAEAGTLQEIIYEYINAKAIFCYDTVASMKSATNLVDGSYAETLGYHARNDGGSGLYKIRTKLVTDTIDEMMLIAIGSTLVAELVVVNEINSKQCGLLGDGTTDETVALNKFFALPNTFDKVLNNGLYISSNTIFIKGRWSDQEPTTQKIIFDRATIKYTGTAGNASIIIFDMKHAEIDGLNIATNSNDNYVQLTGCWYSVFNNWVIRNLKISNDTTQISTLGFSTAACMSLYFSNMRLWRSSLFINSMQGSYINSIFFSNCAIDGHNRNYCIEFNGSNSHQNIVFNECDLSYASTAVIKINDSLTGNGNLKLNNCYLDSSIPLYTDRNNLIVNTVNCFGASNSNKILPIKYEDRITSNFDNSYFQQGNNISGENVNYAVNGDMSSSNEESSGSQLMQSSNAYWTKSYITSPLNINNRARKVTLTTMTTSSNPSVVVRAINAPRTGKYTAYIRLKLIQPNCNSLQFNFGGIYPNWTIAEIGSGEVLLSAQNTIEAGTSLSFGVNFISASQGLDLEVYEVGVVYGDRYQPYAAIHAGARL